MPTTSAAYQREYRRRRRLNAGKPLREAPAGADLVKKPVPRTKWPSDIGRALREWSASKLTIPAGHPRAGLPMEIPDYIEDFAREALAPGIKESLLCLARKNAKTSGCAVLALAHLVPGAPLARDGIRLASISIDKIKANELKAEMQRIAEASGLDLEFMRSPAPGSVHSACGELTILAGDRNAGAAGGYDLVFVDELGLFLEKDRQTLESLLGSLGARDGKLIALTIRGNGIFVDPMIKRASESEPGIHATVYAPDPAAAIDDESTWRAGNPGLGSVKSLDHMRAMCRRARSDPDYETTFRTEELNLPGSASRAMIVTLEQWMECVAPGPALRSGPAFLGLDVGGSVSMCAASCYWPETGRLDTLGCWPQFPELAERGLADGVGNRYVKMQERGELILLGERWADARAFVKHVMDEWLAGVDLRLLISDRYRKEEVAESIGKTQLGCGLEWRALGRGADGHADVAAFKKAVSTRILRPGNSAILQSAIVEAVCLKDPNGNMSLDRGRSRGRIDALTAAVLAIGAGTRASIEKPEPQLFVRHFG